jgi:hypothetical protein
MSVCLSIAIDDCVLDMIKFEEHAVSAKGRCQILLAGAGTLGLPQSR